MDVEGGDIYSNQVQIRLTIICPRGYRRLGHEELTWRARYMPDQCNELTGSSYSIPRIAH